MRFEQSSELSLNHAVANVSVCQVNALEFTHATTIGALTSIAEEGELKPFRCSVFETEIVFLFYGSIFYRAGCCDTKDTLRLPVVFSLAPSVRDEISCYYPFDTGAAYRFKLFAGNEVWLEDRSKFIVKQMDESTPSKIVKLLFENNSKYLYGQAREKTKADTQIVGELLDFYNKDHSILVVDRRRKAIEAHVKKDLKLNGKLKWFAYPNTEERLAAKLTEFVKFNPPEFHPYEPDEAINPYDILVALEADHRKYLKKTYRRESGSNYGS